MNTDIRDLLVRLHRERQTGLLSLVIEGGPDMDGSEIPKEALSLSFVTGELAAAEARRCQGMQAMRHLARARRLLRQRWYPVSSNVLKRMDGMPVLSAWIEQVEAEANPQAARPNVRAQQLDNILRAFHTMGGVNYEPSRLEPRPAAAQARTTAARNAASEMLFENAGDPLKLP